MNRKSRLFGLALLAVLMLALVGGVVTAQDGPKVLVTSRQMGASDIPTLDSSLAEDVQSVQVISELFPELLRLNEETAVVEDGISSLAISEDGLTFTFTLTPEVPWVRYNADSGAVEQVLDENGNPRYVMAQDYVNGIMRTLDPAVASPYAFVGVPWIQGAAEFFNGEAGPEAVQVSALSDYELQVVTTRDSAVTPLIFAMWITAAQPSWAIEEFSDFWIDPANINTYGPFALKDWVRGDGGSLTMIKNPFFPGVGAIPAANLDEVVFRFLDTEPQLTEFEAGTMQVAEPPPTALDRIHADPELSAAYSVVPGNCTYYYGFNVEEPPFDDARVRRAFSMAIDRAAITENVTQSGEAPAGFFTLPALVAAPHQEDFPGLGIHTDLAMAQQLWNEYLTETGTTADQYSPVLFHNTSDLHASIAQAVQQMWNETLGVNVQIQTADFATYLDTRGNYPVFRAGWCFDYPDTHNFLYDTGFHSDGLAENPTHWSNAEYDALVDAALVADASERTPMYAQAEDILVNQDAAIAPIFFYTSDQLTAPGVERTFSIIGREYYEKWDLDS